MEVFEAKKKLLHKLGWSENPFVKDLRVSDKAEFLKYYCPFEADAILKKLAFDSKACMLLGPKGVGKTSAIYFVAFSLPESEFEAVIFKEPPKNLDELAQTAGAAHSGLIEALGGLFGGKKLPIQRQDLANRLKKKGKKTVFFLDEAHLAQNPDMYMEFKYLLDEVPNLRMVISALGRENFPDSLVQLVGDGNIFIRNHFSADEMLRIIEHRIKAVGGLGISPFSKEELATVFSKQNLLTPRYVFDELNNILARLTEKENENADSPVASEKQISSKPIKGKEKTLSKNKAALEKKSKTSQGQDVEEGEAYDEDFEEENDFEPEKPAAYSGPYADDPIVRSAIERESSNNPQPISASRAFAKITTNNAEWWPLLSPSQADVMKFLIANTHGTTLAELLKGTGLSQNTAFNALYQLRGEDAAEKKRKPEVPFPLVVIKQKLVGHRRKNLYFANPKIRNLFTLH